MVTDDALIDVMEPSMALMPEVPGRLQFVSFPGIKIQGRVTGIIHPFANMVCCAGLSDEPGAQIAEVCAFFWDQNLPFAWLIGPRTRPADLSAHLSTAGLFPGTQMAGLALRDISVGFPHDPAIRVRETDPDDPDDAAWVARLASVGFEFPMDLCELFADSYRQTAVRSRCYLAYEPGKDEPSAFAATVYLPDSPVVLLGGAATVPEGRSKGLYQALVARRLIDALADGRESAIIQAVRTTSAPILVKRGFEEICSLELWIGLPPSMRPKPEEVSPPAAS